MVSSRACASPTSAREAGYSRAEALLDEALSGGGATTSTRREVQESFTEVVRDNPSAVNSLVGSVLASSPISPEQLMKARPVTIRVPRKLVDVTRANVRAIESVARSNRRLMVEGDDSSPYQEILMGEEWRLDAKVPPPARDVQGLRLDEWRAMIAAAVELYRQGKDITADAILKLNRRIDPDKLRKCIQHRNFGRALELRGVTASWLGLSERQLMALSVLTNYVDTRSVAAKLKSLGIKTWEFQAWQANSVFRKAYRDASEQLFTEAQSTVNVALTQNATKGDLRSIKYFNELSGRWNPAEQSNTDVRQVLTAVVEVITSTVTDPDLLKQISAKLANVMVAFGASAPSTSRGQLD